MPILLRVACLALAGLLLFQPALLHAASAPPLDRDDQVGTRMLLLGHSTELFMIPTQSSDLPMMACLSVDDRVALWTPPMWNPNTASYQSMLLNSAGDVMVVGYGCDTAMPGIQTITGFRPQYITINGQLILHILELGRDQSAGGAPYMVISFESGGQTLATLELREDAAFLEALVSACETAGSALCTGFTASLLPAAVAAAMDVETWYNFLKFLKDLLFWAAIALSIWGMIAAAPAVLAAGGLAGLLGTAMLFNSMVQTGRDITKQLLGDDYTNSAMDEPLDAVKDKQADLDSFDCAVKAVGVLVQVAGKKVPSTIIPGECVGSLVGFADFVMGEYGY